MPRDVARAQIEIDEDFFRVADLLDDQLRSRTGMEVRRRKRLAVALKILPVERHTLEALLVPLLEVARVDAFLLRLRLLFANAIDVRSALKTALAGSAAALSGAADAVAGSTVQCWRSAV